MQSGFAFGKFEALALAFEAALAEFGQEGGQANEGLGIIVNRFLECREVELGEQLGNVQGGDLLGGFVNLVVFVLANGFEGEFQLAAGILQPLLVL